MISNQVEMSPSVRTCQGLPPLAIDGRPFGAEEDGVSVFSPGGAAVNSQAW